MKIHISSGIGEGPTDLAAFDAALNSAGIDNFNLIVLSSIIPPASSLIIHEKGIPKGTFRGGWGDRLYIVLARAYALKPRREAWAGIGWIQDPDSRRGIFVEHGGDTEASVRNDIDASLRTMATRRGMNPDSIMMRLTGAACTGAPSCALTVAVYQAEEWHREVDPARTSDAIVPGKTSKRQYDA